MSRAAARRFTEDDKARVFATLTANGGNVKATVRDCDVPAPTIRRWRGEWERSGPPPADIVTKAVTDFLGDAERIRNLALAKLEQKISSGDIKASELITALGVLDDKITRAKGLDVKRVEHTHLLPDRESMAELMGQYVVAGIAAAERRHEEIVEAEVVEVRKALPAGA